ncbi:MAG: hypothetical protein WD030_10385 [Pirellulales bacterium]
MTEPQEIEPFIVFHAGGDAAEVALWKLADGRQAIALFMDQESAEGYRAAAGLTDDWQVFQPDRAALVTLLHAALDSGVEFVVLQPTADSAQRLWSISDVLANADQEN